MSDRKGDTDTQEVAGREHISPAATPPISATGRPEPGQS